MNKKIKSPTELFEEKRLAAIESLKELQSQKILEENTKILNKKIKSPQELFNVFSEEKLTEDVKDSYVETLVEDDIQLEEEFVVRKNYIQQINPKKYDYKIDRLEKDILEVKSELDKIKKVDTSDICLKIESLKEVIEKVKKEIPEQVLYDDHLKNLSDEIESVRHSIPEIPEVKYYDNQIQSIVNLIDTLRKEIPFVPEVKYYDEQILNLEALIRGFPEVKYYDEQLKVLEEEIDKVRTEIPDVRYYDNDILILQEKINQIKSEIPKVPEVKYYDGEIEDLENKIQQVRSEIPKVPEVKYYDGEIEDLENKIQQVRSEIPEAKYYDGEIEDLENKIQQVRSEIPEVKYYDGEIEKLTEDIDQLKNKLVSFKIKESENVKSLYEIFVDKTKEVSKKTTYIEEVLQKFNEQSVLNEELLNEPLGIKNEDPLTPINKNFVTLDQLKEHYRLFINRVQQQLATIGGGGETQLKYLDDIVGIATNPAAYNNRFLRYNHSIQKFEFVAVELQNLTDVDVSNLNDGYLMVWNAAASNFVFVSPQTLGINNDANIDTEITDYGTY